MKNIQHIIRIKDIAKLSGVSEGTVDRVLHKRGEVSQKSRDAVNKALDELNYSPNIFARSLASKKQYHFIAIIPEHSPNDYWENIEKGFDIASQEFKNYNVHIDKIYYNQFDSFSFSEVSRQILATEFDAVFVAPVFRQETLCFTKELTARGIPFSFFDSLIEEADYLTYYGQHSFRSGYIGAKLLLQSLDNQVQVMVFRTHRTGETVSNQTSNRYKGFMKYIDDEKSGVFELINVELINNDELSNRKIISDVLSKYSNIKAAITFNSRVNRLARHFETLNHNNIRLVGYDLLEENIKYLKLGYISYLIAQRPDKQTYFTVRDMCKKLIFDQPVNKINYVPIDILMKENIDDFIQFGE